MSEAGQDWAEQTEAWYEKQDAERREFLLENGLPRR